MVSIRAASKMSEPSNGNASDLSKSQDESEKKKLLKLLLQLFHLVLAAAILLVGVVEFSVEPTIFDVFGKKREQRSLFLKEVVWNVYGVSFNMMR